jgi:hypothetical protein
MHPRTSDVLSKLVAAADRMIKADRPADYAEELEHFDKLLAEVKALRDLPTDDGLFDDATVWLAQALRNAAREGVAGDCKKWIELAKCLLPWVRTDLAEAIGAAHLPAAGAAQG